MLGSGATAHGIGLPGSEVTADHHRLPVLEVSTGLHRLPAREVSAGLHLRSPPHIEERGGRRSTTSHRSTTSRRRLTTSRRRSTRVRVQVARGGSGDLLILPSPAPPSADTPLASPLHLPSLRRPRFRRRLAPARPRPPSIWPAAAPSALRPGSRRRGPPPPWVAPLRATTALGRAVPVRPGSRHLDPTHFSWYFSVFLFISK